MRLVLKLIAAPFALALTVMCAVFSFVLSASEVLLGIVSGVLFLASVVLLATGQTAGGLAWLAVAFLISPFGLPAFAGLIVKGLDGLGSMLKGFIFG